MVNGIRKEGHDTLEQGRVWDILQKMWEVELDLNDE